MTRAEPATWIGTSPGRSRAVPSGAGPGSGDILTPVAHGLPDPFAAELAWMPHWQASDGTRVSMLAVAQLANMIRRAVTEGRDIASLIWEMDYAAAAALQS